jgi:tripartite-type tricarboxylate transporter receptor subunit TctC
MNYLKTFHNKLIVAGAGLLLACGAHSQTGDSSTKWPTAPVRFIVPFPAGAAPDVLIRYAGTKLSERWGRPIVIENRPGGSGSIGMNAILNAPADGSTLGFVQGSAISLAPSLIKGVSYDFERDFSPITLAAVLPLVLAVPADSPYKALPDLIVAAKAKPQGIEVADVGRGTAPHLAASLLGMQAGVEFLHVHYQGGAQALQGTLGGQTQMMVDSYNVVVGNVQGGKLRILASMADRVEPGLEEFPLANKVVPGAVAYGWFAVIAKKGVPPHVLAKVNKDMNEVLSLPDVVAKSKEMGTYNRPGTPDELVRFVREDRRTWQRVLDRLKIKPE